MRRVSCMGLGALLIAAIAGSTTASGAVVRYAGVVSDVDRAAATLTIDEVGPWRLEQGQTVITKRTIRWDPETRFVRYRRATDAPSGYRGDFVEQRVDASAVSAGTFVAVECERDDGRLRALSVAIPELSEP